VVFDGLGQNKNAIYDLCLSIIIENP